MNSYRLTVCDYYLCPPIRGYDVTYSEFRGSDVKQVPIVRIFGSSTEGKKACLHIHGVFPYIYVPYEGSEPPERLKYQLAASLDKAINISLGQANATTQHVFKIALVSGTPFYGYHEKEHQFFKIYLYNPNLIKRATDLLQNGTVLGKVHQTHEAHVPFILQFMIDYNLQGMNLVNCSHVTPRRANGPVDWEAEEEQQDERQVPLKVSVCEEEFDVAAADILNRLEALDDGVVNPGLAALWEDEHQRRRTLGKVSQPTPQTSQPRPFVVTASEDFFRQRLLQRLQDISQLDDSSISTQSPDSRGGSIPYPVEVPDNSFLLNASHVDPHTPHRSTRGSTTDPTSDQEANQSISSQLMDSQDADLLNILGELAWSQSSGSQEAQEKEQESCKQEEQQEEDSILSLQDLPPASHPDIGPEDEERESLEMSQPFTPLLASRQALRSLTEDAESLTVAPDLKEEADSEDSSNPSTPRNIVWSSSDSEGERSSQETLKFGGSTDEELWDTLDRIPQLDGGDDDSNDSQPPVKGRRLGARGPLIPIKVLKDSEPLKNPLTPLPSPKQNFTVSSTIPSPGFLLPSPNLAQEQRTDSNLDLSSLLEELEEPTEFPEKTASSQSQILEYLQEPPPRSPPPTTDQPSTSVATGMSDLLVSHVAAGLDALSTCSAGEFDDISSIDLPEGNDAMLLLEEELTHQQTSSTTTVIGGKNISNPVIGQHRPRLGLRHGRFTKRERDITPSSSPSMPVLSPQCSPVTRRRVQPPPPLVEVTLQNPTTSTVQLRPHPALPEQPNLQGTWEVEDDPPTKVHHLNFAIDLPINKNKSHNININICPNEKNPCEGKKMTINWSVEDLQQPRNLRSRSQSNRNKERESSQGASRNREGESSQGASRNRGGESNRGASRNREEERSRSARGREGETETRKKVKPCSVMLTRLTPEEILAATQREESEISSQEEWVPSKRTRKSSRKRPSKSSSGSRVQYEVSQSTSSTVVLRRREPTSQSVATQEIIPSSQESSTPSGLEQITHKSSNKTSKLSMKFVKNKNLETPVIPLNFQQPPPLSPALQEDPLPAEGFPQPPPPSPYYEHPDPSPYPSFPSPSCYPQPPSVNREEEPLPCPHREIEPPQSPHQETPQSPHQDQETPSSPHEVEPPPSPHQEFESPHHPTQEMETQTEQSIDQFESDTDGENIIQGSPEETISKPKGKKVLVTPLSPLGSQQNLSTDTDSEFEKNVTGNRISETSSEEEIAPQPPQKSPLKINTSKRSLSISKPKSSPKKIDPKLTNKPTFTPLTIISHPAVEKTQEVESLSEQGGSSELQPSQRAPEIVRENPTPPSSPSIVVSGSEGEAENSLSKSINIVYAALTSEDRASELSTGKSPPKPKRGRRKRSKNKVVPPTKVYNTRSSSKSPPNSPPKVTNSPPKAYNTRSSVSPTISPAKIVNTRKSLELISTSPKSVGSKSPPNPRTSTSSVDRNSQPPAKRQRVSSVESNIMWDEPKRTLLPSPPEEHIESQISWPKNEEGPSAEKNLSADIKNLPDSKNQNSITTSDVTPKIDSKNLIGPPVVKNLAAVEYQQEFKKFVGSTSVPNQQQDWCVRTSREPQSGLELVNLSTTTLHPATSVCSSASQMDHPPPPNLDLSCVSEEDLGITSFYELTQLEPTQTPDLSLCEGPEMLLEPQYNPPSRLEVLENLEEHHLLEVKFQEPYYSLPSDVQRSKEVGGRTLKLVSHSACDLPEFSTIFSVNKFKSHLLDTKILIEPLHPAPSCEEVVKFNAKSKIEPPTVTPAKLRVQLPQSPGREENSDEDSLTLSPCSPEVPRSQERPWTPISPAPASQERKNKKNQPRPKSLFSPKPPSQEIIPSSQQSPSYSPLEILTGKRKFKSRNGSKRRVRTPTSQDSRPNSRENMLEEQEKPLSERSGSTERPGTPQEHPLPPSTVKGEGGLTSSTPMPRTWVARRGLTPARRVSTQSDSWCKIEGPSPDNTFGFKVQADNLQEARAVVQPHHLTVLCLEVHSSSRAELHPDPEIDEVGAVVFLAFCDDGRNSRELGVIAVLDDGEVSRPAATLAAGPSGRGCAVLRAVSEEHLVRIVVDVVRHWDPDILLGYEIEMSSWGYLIQRAAHLGINLTNLLSRVPKPDRAAPAPAPAIPGEPPRGRGGQHGSQGALTEEVSELKIPGRIVINLWRLLKHEVSLQSYVYENVVFHVLHERVPRHSERQLSLWWEQPSGRFRWLVTDYLASRVLGQARLMDRLDLLGRTAELAKLFGIQFFEVLSRGSQFRVESMMLRLAKPRNYVPVSPSVVQRAHMRAPEYIPLVMEPESRFYQDPVIVLDFQSLYPSMMIAYNYCFSTCLGRVEHLGQDTPFEFGCTQLRVPQRVVRGLVRDSKAHVSPCGVAFVPSSLREGVLPRMLKEILDTRLMVKQAMKQYKTDAALQRVLHARQLGLKLIANVTYGYTAANFSGRMPCIEVADSVVSKGRETLERAMAMVSTRRDEWDGARVVYGDTDSMFVLVPGRSRKRAFEIGAEIAAAVTADNPTPVKLKLEKVYQPCILQTKKRYVGFMYESSDQEKPVYEAKGIETVRRDGCPAVSKMLERSLRLLFEGKDVSVVKSYVTRQFQKLLMGRSNLQDLVFAKEFRGINGYKPGACVPALELTRQWLRSDRRAEPRRGERVPYVIVSGAPGLPLIRLVRSPHELLKDPTLRVNAEYYITRAISPALDRCLSLIGADVHQWYSEMPRRTMASLPCSTLGGAGGGGGRGKGTISQYFATSECAACRQQTREGLCVECQTEPQRAALTLADKTRRWERTSNNINKICEGCCGRSFDTECTSLVCPILFRRCLANRELQQAPFVRQLCSKFFDF